MFRLSFDIGGTNLKVALVENYKIKDRRSFLCSKIENKDILEELIVKTINNWKEKYEFETFDFLGLGVPGEVSDNKIIKTPNLKLDIKNLPYNLSKTLNQSVKVENDAVCASIADFLSLENKPKSFLAVTLGTGIGGSLIYNGKIYRGAGFAPLEIGHTVIEKDGIECSCGRAGCFEKYASTSSLMKYYQEKSKVFKTAEEIMDLYQKNDETAKETIERFVDYLSLGLVNLINIFAPDLILLSGTFCKSMEPIMNMISCNVNKYKYSKDDKLPKIKLSSLGENAGLLGAAYLDFEEI